MPVRQLELLYSRTDKYIAPSAPWNCSSLHIELKIRIRAENKRDGRRESAVVAQCRESEDASHGGELLWPVLALVHASSSWLHAFWRPTENTLSGDPGSSKSPCSAQFNGFVRSFFGRISVVELAVSNGPLRRLPVSG